MALLIFALVAIFVASALFLSQIVFAWLAVIMAIPVAYIVGYALSRVLRAAGVL